MNHFVYKKKDVYKVCFLVNKIQLSNIELEYLTQIHVDLEDVLLIDLYKDPKRKKTPYADMQEYLREVKEVLRDFGVEYVLVCNGDYFKVFTKETKVEVHLGYVKKVDDFKVIYCPSFESVFMDPIKTRSKIQRALETLDASISGTYVEPGTLQFTGKYPKTFNEIWDTLEELFHAPALTCDIETFSLRPSEAGIASIGFALNQKEGVSFKVDVSQHQPNQQVRELLRQFFEAYQGKLIFHNIAFDASVLIYQLYMNDITDTEGLLTGMEALLKNFEDTKLIAYLATNSCAGNVLGLKALAHEFAGNWAQEEIGDISKIPEKDLLEYNLIDCLATWFVYDKYWPQMFQDNQEEIYRTLFIPATRDIIQMQLTGFPLDMNRVLEVEKELQKDSDEAMAKILGSTLIKNFVDVLKQEWVSKRNQELKVKRVTLEDATKIEFNPRSHLQLQRLLYEVMELPVLNRTDSNQPATDADTLKTLLNHTQNEECKQVLQGLIDFAAVDKILGTFIVAMKAATYSPKMNWYFLTGNFNLGGTVSGRLSSNRPNLQNLPATGSKYAKVVKSCFKAPPGWLLTGLDFNALEDHISALITKDKNKLKVYTDHYDGHCLRAFSYWPEKMPDIQNQVDEVNKEGKTYKVTYEDGTVEYLNEHNPKLKEIKNGYA